MNQLLYDNFLKELEKIERYVKHIILLKDFDTNIKNVKIESLNNFHINLKEFSREKKLFEHKSIIISLYGLLESTVSDWVQTHIENVSNLFKNYDELPQKIKKNHLEFSIRVIDEIIKKKHSKYENLDVNSIIKNLYQISTVPMDFDLNKEAYIPNSGNLKHSKIVSLLKDIGIDLEFKVKKFDISNEFSLLSVKIDNLVTFRNDIAHGNHIEEILNISEFSDYIRSLRKYIFNIFQVINEKEIEYESQVLYYQIEEMNIINVYRNSLLDLYMENDVISINDSIIIYKDELYIKAIITDIHINRISYKNAVLSKKENICLQIDKNIRKNYKFFIKKKDYESLNYSSLIYNKELP